MIPQTDKENKYYEIKKVYEIQKVLVLIKIMKMHLNYIIK